MSDLAPNAASNAALPDAAKSPDGYTELPTGYIDEAGTLHTDAVVRELTGEEEDILASRRIPGHTKMQKLLEHCVVSIGTLSQESRKGDWGHIIKNLVVTDRLHLTIAVRMASLGNVYTFRVKCPECETIQGKAADLADFKVHGMGDPMLRTWKGKLPKSGWEYTAKVQSGAEEEKLAKAQEKTNDTLSLAMLARLVELNGQMPVTLPALKKLPMSDRLYLRDDFKAHEGELDNQVEVTCKECGHEFTTAIDIGDKGFFFPSET